MAPLVASDGSRARQGRPREEERMRALPSVAAVSFAMAACGSEERATPLRTPPTLFVTSGNDTLVEVGVERADFPRLCGMGYQLEYLECADAGHSEGAVWSLPEQVAWLKDRLAGKPIAADRLCQVQAPTRCSGQPPQ
jgi:hypothetical protein